MAKDLTGLVCRLEHSGPKWLHVSPRSAVLHARTCKAVVRHLALLWDIALHVCGGAAWCQSQGHWDWWPWSPSHRKEEQEPALKGEEGRAQTSPPPFHPRVWVPSLYLQHTGSAPKSSLRCIASPLRMAEGIINWLLREVEVAHWFSQRDEWGPNLLNTDAWHWTQI